MGVVKLMLMLGRKGVAEQIASQGEDNFCGSVHATEIDVNVSSYSSNLPYYTYYTSQN